MTKLFVSNLDAYTQFVLPLILAKFPGWELFGVVQERSDGAGSTVEFNIPCPSPDVKKGLWVSTADEELSVGFHTHHDHFTDYLTRSDPDNVEAGLDEAAAYLEDRRGVVTWYQGDRVVGTTVCELPLSGPLPQMFSKLPITRGTLRSWSGQFDRDESSVEPIAAGDWPHTPG